MRIYEYISNRLYYDEVESWIDAKGSQGWRLHTAEPCAKGTWIFVVMDKAFEVDELVEESIGPHGIEMKG